MPAQRSDLAVIGFAEALSAPEVVWSLVDAGYRILAFGREGTRSSLSCSRYVKIVPVPPPERHIGECLAALSSLLEAHTHLDDRLIFLPMDDAALWLCTQLERRTNWLFPELEGMRVALDKQRQIELARAAGLNVPETRFVTNHEGLSEAVSTYPVIVRPADAIAVTGERMRKDRNWICSNETEMLRIHDEWSGESTLMAQPYLHGAGEGVFGLAVEDGITVWSSHRRLRMMNPHGSGSSACVSQAAPQELKAPIATFLSSCNWRGMFMIELLRTPDDRLWFVEFNGRAWGSMALSRKQKLEYPAWTVRTLAEPNWRPDLPEPLKADIECRNLGREFMHLLFVIRGPQSQAITRWPSLWSTLLEMLQLTRPVFLYNWRPNDWRVLFCDFWRTIGSQLFKRTN